MRLSRSANPIPALLFVAIFAIGCAFAFAIHGACSAVLCFGAVVLAVFIAGIVTSAVQILKQWHITPKL